MEQALRRKELEKKSLSSKCTQNGNGEIQMCLFFVSGETSQCLSVINCQMVHIVFSPGLEVFPFSGENGKIPSKAIQIIYEFAIIDLYHFTITFFKYYSIFMEEHIVSYRTDVQRSCFFHTQHTGKEAVAFFYKFPPSG